MSGHKRGPSINSARFAVPPIEPSVRVTEDEGSDNRQGLEFDDDDAVTVSSLSSYAGSAASISESGAQPLQHLSDTITQAFDASALDRVIVLQAQSSGMVHAKTRELEQLQEATTQRLEEVRRAFAADTKAGKQLLRDLEWTQKRVASLVKRTKVSHPIEYAQATEKIKGLSR